MNELTYGKAIVNLRAFLKDDEISSVIKSLNLIPDFQDWRIWRDNFGYVLKFKSDKTYYVEKKIWNGPINDLYFKSSFEQILDNSLRLYPIFDSKKEMWSLGKDQKLRKFYFSDIWKRKSCLSSSLEELKKIIRILNVEQDVPYVWKCPVTLQQRKMTQD